MRSGRLAFGAILALAIVACSKRPAAVGVDPTQSWIGRAAPPIALKSLDGKNVALADYKGKLVVLHFGASW